MEEHLKFMLRCLELAERGSGFVAPNPMVGALLVKDSQVLSSGYHQQFGGPHAEVIAVQAFCNPRELKDCTLYVNLEPCCHQGKTPPCTQLIINSGIKKVVFGELDPSREVAGQGSLILADAGIEVVSGIAADQCRQLNRRFYTFHTKHRPYIVLKWAQTADGFLARPDGSSRWISCQESLEFAHKLRASEAAVLVGTKTALTDDPELTVRHVSGKNPLRIVLDRQLKVPSSYRIFDQCVPTLVFNHAREETVGEVLYCAIPDWGSGLLTRVLQRLHRLKVLSIMAEGGATLLTSLIEQGLWDEAFVVSSPHRFGSGLAAPCINPRLIVSETDVGIDRHRYYVNPHSAATGQDLRYSSGSEV